MYNLRSGRTVPFLILHGGYLFPIEKSRTSYGAIINNGNAPGMIWPWPVVENTPFKAKGGFLVNPAIGIFSQTRSGYAITISAGYRFHRLNYAANNDYSLDVDYNRLTIKLGIIIN